MHSAEYEFNLKTNIFSKNIKQAIIIQSHIHPSTHSLKNTFILLSFTIIEM